MQNQHLLNRREFTLEAALALLSGVVITVSGCGSTYVSPTSPSPEPSPSPSPSPGPSGDVTGTISSNHGHVAMITRARLTAGNALSLDIAGSANHSHTVELSQSDLAAIAGGQRVSHQSTTDDGHLHTVAFN